jgi:Ca2+-binding EF-hand superfamily protein
VARTTFDAVARALIAFDIVDRNHDSTLDTREVGALLWLTTGRKPTPERVAFEMQSIDTDGTHSVSRLEWLRYMSVPALLSDGDSRTVRFDSNVKAMFDKYDVDGSGAMNVSEFRALVIDTLKRELGSHLTEHGSLVLASIADGAAAELHRAIDVNNDKRIQWDELRGHLDLIWHKQREVLSWFFEFQANKAARIFSFSTTPGAVVLLESELTAMLQNSLTPAIKYHIIDSERARTLVADAKRRILQLADTNGDGKLDIAEVGSKLEAILAVEKEMIRSVGGRKWE